MATSAFQHLMDYFYFVYQAHAHSISKFLVSAKTPVVVEAPKPKDEPVSTPKAPGKYVPPAQRMAAASTTLSGGYSVSRRKKEAPNVNSEFDFPTLGGCPG